MNNEQQKLLKLLDSKKITAEDYALLSESLKEKSESHLTTFLINPYSKISEPQALLIGLSSLIFLGFIAPLASLHFPGLLDLQTLKSSDQGFNSWRPLLQNCIAVLAWSLITFGLAHYFKQRNLRIVDFFLTSLLNRIPYFVATLILFLAFSSLKINPLTWETNPPEKFLLLGISFIALLALTWHLVMLFISLKQSSGLQDKNLWIAYITAIISGEVLTIIITRSFLN